MLLGIRVLTSHESERPGCSRLSPATLNASNLWPLRSSDSAPHPAPRLSQVQARWLVESAEHNELLNELDFSPVADEVRGHASHPLLTTDSNLLLVRP